MLTIRFYWAFKKFQYLLIAQPDALIIRDANYMLALLAKHGFDYWGAPWKNIFERRKIDYTLYHKRLEKFKLPKRFSSPALSCEVGNGGLSLRNVSSTIRLLRRFVVYKFLWGGPEDCFFSYFGQLANSFYKIATKETAALFSLEETLHDQLHRQELPFGVHDWQHYFPDFMAYWDKAQHDNRFFNRVFNYQVGQSLFFDARHFNASPYIISGLSCCEEAFSWFVSKDVEFAFLLDGQKALDDILQLEFSVASIFGNMQAVRIYANGQFVGKKLIVPGNNLTVELAGISAAELMLRLEFPDAQQVKSHAVGEDVRALSIAVTRMDSRYRSR